MKKWIVRIVNTSAGMVRNVKVYANTKQEAIDRVSTKEDEYIGFCCEEK